MTAEFDDVSRDTEGKLAKAVPEVLFVCVHNSGRSQMAAGLLKSTPPAESTSAPRAPTRPIRSIRPWCRR